jgi:nicotinate-nucleotide adenylyltransferase
MKIGIFIGSFNPPHLGHLDIIKYLLNKKYVDKILIVPTKNYWNKTNLIDINKRIAMLKFYENDNIKVDTSNNNYQYTYQLMRKLKKEYSHDELYLIIGADNIINFKKWKNYEELLTYNIIIMTRNNIDILKYTSHLTGKFTVVNDYNFTDISSTKIRNNVFLNKKYLQEDIYHYIIENKLYNAADKILTEHISSS